MRSVLNIILTILPAFCIFTVISLPLHSQNVLSIQPLFTERDLTLHREVESVWLFDGSNDSLILQKAGDNFYSLEYSSGGKKALFEAAFVAAGKNLLLDICPRVADTISDDYYRSSLLAAHRIFKVNVTKDTLLLRELSYKWFYERSLQKNGSLNYMWSNDGMTLVMSTAELKAYLSEHIHEKGFFDQEVVFVKKRKLPQNNVLSKKISPVSRKQNNDKLFTTFQDYVPAFPMQGGWLGGDGNVSVPLGGNKTLWLFSDSYVGLKDQHSRAKGFKIIPNSVAITSNKGNGHSTITYFWRDQYSKIPGPIFQSFSNRYKYWISDAFMYKTDLYVLLHKIGPKPGAAPGDLFNFNHIGETMAKISNAESVSPEKWRIELYPYSKFFDSNINVNTLVKEGEYVYFFLNRNGRVTQLARLHVDHLSDPGNRFQYYSSSHTWKQGLDSADMETIIQGVPGNTIRYHDDVKEWIMLSGPGFLDNKIVMRSSQSLTGPWSQDKVIYECPEVTPGTTSFDSSNYCYLGREHIQFYNRNTHTMLITYDWNTSDGSKLNDNSKIYVPRVITIRLRE